MKRNCTNCSHPFEIPDEDLTLLDHISPTFAETKHPIPPPMLCPPCRFERRLSFRNAKNLYHRKSNLSGKQIVSMFSADNPYIVYDQDEWWSDKWDALSFGRDFNFERTFADQFNELNLVVPHMSLNTKNVENSYYTNFTLNMKDSYLVFGGANDEDCLYCYFVSNSKDCVDCLSLYRSELCYEGIASEGCYNCQFFLNCRHCTDCFLVEECSNCSNCILCFGLHRKEYCYLNEQVGKTRYLELREKLNNVTRPQLAELKKQLDTLKSTLPHRASHIYASENCSGDMIFESKNCRHSFDILLSEDCGYLCFSPRCLSSMDATFNSPEGVELCYEVCSTVGTRTSIATFHSWYNDSTFYSIECHSCKNIFGCVGLRFKEYCIFNKQYSKEDYEKLASKIATHMTKTGEWGEFFPTAISQFGYNETIAAEYFPWKEHAVREKGWKWHQEADESPPSIKSSSENVSICKVSGKRYKMIAPELTFYKKLNLPLPEECFDVRHENRQQKRTPRMLWERPCSKCTQPVDTTYSPDRPEVIYCEECYSRFFY